MPSSMFFQANQALVAPYNVLGKLSTPTMLNPMESCETHITLQWTPTFYRIQFGPSFLS